MRHEVYIELNNKLTREYYQREHKVYKDYRLMGLDGCGIELPEIQALAEEFGRVNNNDQLAPMSWTTVVYDLLNNIAIDARMNRNGESEREHAIKQLRTIKEEGRAKKDIIVADRGFPSLEMIVELLVMGYDFVMRYTGTQFLKETREFVESEETDKIIEISLTEGAHRRGNERLKEIMGQGFPEKISVRIVKILLKTGEYEYLITSLTNKEEFEESDFEEIYMLRWNEEVYFDFQKNVMEVENFSGKTVETVKQDYYSRLLVGNIHALIVEDAQEEIDKEVAQNSNLKYEKYKVNRSVSFGFQRNRINKLLFKEGEDWINEYNRLVKKSKREKISVIPDRKFERKKNIKKKYAMAKRRAI